VIVIACNAKLYIYIYILCVKKVIGDYILEKHRKGLQKSHCCNDMPQQRHTNSDNNERLYSYITLSNDRRHYPSYRLTKLYSVALVRKRTIPTEWPPNVGEVSAKFFRIKCVAWSAQRIPTAVNLDFLDTEPLLFHSSSSLVILTRLRGLSSRKSGSVGNRTRGLWICSQEFWSLHHRGGHKLES
jgi:hypothetical protein